MNDQPLEEDQDIEEHIAPFKEQIERYAKSPHELGYRRFAEART